MCSRKGNIMYTTRAGTGYPFINIKIYFFPAYTAIHKGIAVFFYSTYFHLMPVHILKYYFIFKKSASALWWMRFSVVGKRLFLAFCYTRVQPLRFWIFNFQIIIEDRCLEDNFLYEYQNLPFFIEKNRFVRAPPTDSSFQKYYEWRIRK